MQPEILKCDFFHMPMYAVIGQCLAVRLFFTAKKADKKTTDAFFNLWKFAADVK